MVIMMWVVVLLDAMLLVFVLVMSMLVVVSLILVLATHDEDGVAAVATNVYVTGIDVDTADVYVYSCGVVVDIYVGTMLVCW